MRRGFTLLALCLLAACGGSSDGSPHRGGLCGVPGLVGEPVPDVTSRSNSACGIVNPVRVTSVGGVALSSPALMTCRTARALDQWVENGAKPAVGRRGGGLAEFTVAAHYACRTRNSQPGARISEHARGRAIDISAVVFEDGSRVTVLDGWDGARADRRLLRRMHGAACGPFGTVLGPESDRFHRDHFHFDVASHRSGPYCR